jgi:hypothetical protein
VLLLAGVPIEKTKWKKTWSYHHFPQAAVDALLHRVVIPLSVVSLHSLSPKKKVVVPRVCFVLVGFPLLFGTRVPNPT